MVWTRSQFPSLGAASTASRWWRVVPPPWKRGGRGLTSQESAWMRSLLLGGYLGTTEPLARLTWNMQPATVLRYACGRIRFAAWPQEVGMEKDSDSKWVAAAFIVFFVGLFGMIGFSIWNLRNHVQELAKLGYYEQGNVVRKIE